MRAVAIVAVLVCAACGGAAPTDLSYTLRMDVRDGPVAATPVDPALAAVGEQTLERLVPGGSVVINVIAGPRGARLGMSKAVSGLPAGSMMLQRADGAVVIIDPKSKTYWDSPSEITAGTSADRQVTGVMSTVAGEQVERVTFRMNPPAVDVNPLSRPGMIEGEAWVARRFKKYTEAQRPVTTEGGLILFQLADLGLSMRQIMRSPMFSGREIEATVTRLSETRAESSVFEIPAGYTEVPRPGGGGS